MIVSCARLAGEYVVNPRNEDVGQIARIMIEVGSGRVAYAVVAGGGVFGIGERHYAIPWQAFTLDAARRLVLAVELTDFEDAPEGFLISDTM